MLGTYTEKDPFIRFTHNPMSDVSFNEQDLGAPSTQKQPKGFYGLVVRAGLAKDEAGARVVLIIAIIVLVGIAIAYPIIFG